jgi:hypothetical protein
MKIDDKMRKVSMEFVRFPLIAPLGNIFIA